MLDRLDNLHANPIIQATGMTRSDVVRAWRRLEMRYWLLNSNKCRIDSTSQGPCEGHPCYAYMATIDGKREPTGWVCEDHAARALSRDHRAFTHRLFQYAEVA